MTKSLEDLALIVLNNADNTKALDAAKSAVNRLPLESAERLQGFIASVGKLLIIDTRDRMAETIRAGDLKMSLAKE